MHKEFCWNRIGSSSTVISVLTGLMYLALDRIFALICTQLKKQKKIAYPPLTPILQWRELGFVEGEESKWRRLCHWDRRSSTEKSENSELHLLPLSSISLLPLISFHNSIRCLWVIIVYLYLYIIIFFFFFSGSTKLISEVSMPMIATRNSSKIMVINIYIYIYICVCVCVCVCVLWHCFCCCCCFFGLKYSLISKVWCFMCGKWKL